ncbi:MAG: hypothetical protein ACRECU_05105 [Methylocella sp.]
MTIILYQPYKNSYKTWIKGVIWPLRWIADCSVAGTARKLRRIRTVCTIVLPPVGAGAAFAENPPLPVSRPAVLGNHLISVALSSHGPANTAEGEAGTQGAA